VHESFTLTGLQHMLDEDAFALVPCDFPIGTRHARHFLLWAVDSVSLVWRLPESGRQHADLRPKTGRSAI